MAEVTAAAVKALRDRTGLPLMDCKRALLEAEGDPERAIEILKREGKKLEQQRAGRETAFGRFGLYYGLDRPVGAMVEVRCESAPVAQNEQVVQFADDLARQLAEGPGAATVDELLAQPSPSHPGQTLGEQKDDLFNRIREVFNVTRLVRLEGPCFGYFHNLGTVCGVLVQVEGGNEEAAKDVAMHIAAMRPEVLTREEVPQEVVAKERELLLEAARNDPKNQGKPDEVLQKIVEGRLRTTLFARTVLLDQPFVKDEKLTVGQYAKQHGMTIRGFVRWEL